MNNPIIMQLILTLVAALGLERVFSRMRARAMGPGLAVVWLLGTIVFLIFVWLPDIANRVSTFLGIGRGVDAALYVAVALLFYVLLRMLIRLEHQEHLITKLVSQIALLKEEVKRKK